MAVCSLGSRAEGVGLEVTGLSREQRELGMGKPKLYLDNILQFLLIIVLQNSRVFLIHPTSQGSP